MTLGGLPARFGRIDKKIDFDASISLETTRDSGRGLIFAFDLRRSGPKIPRPEDRIYPPPSPWPPSASVGCRPS